MSTSQAKPLMLGTFSIGVLCALVLPAVSITRSGFMIGSMSLDVSLIDLIKTSGDEDAPAGPWILLISGLGLLIAGAGILDFDERDPGAQPWAITGGVVMVLLLPVRLLIGFNQLTDKASSQGALMLLSLGSGIIIASIALIITAAIPWYLLSKGVQSAAENTISTMPSFQPSTTSRVQGRSAPDETPPQWLSANRDKDTG